jgi:hypothetical protein
MNLEDKIIDYISKYFKGNGNPVTAEFMAKEFGLTGYQADAGDIQQSIGNIRRAKKAMIGSHSGGFFLIVTDTDMNITQAYIKNRIAPIVAASKALDDMWFEAHGAKAQGDFFQ